MRCKLIFAVLFLVTPIHAGELWITADEVMRQPIGTPAWRAVVRYAQGVGAPVALDQNNSRHDVATLAAAIKATRLQDDREKEKVVQALERVVKVGQGDLKKTLALARGLQSYVIAADIIDYRDPAFMDWVQWAVTVELSGHSGGRGILEVAELSDNNHGGHARAALAVAGLYLGRDDWVKDVTRWYLAIIGETADYGVDWSSTNWHDADLPRKFGIAPAEARVEDINLSGSQPEEMRRSGEFSWPPDRTNYPWEGLQSIVTVHYVLTRAKKIDVHAGNDAVVRAFEFMYRTVQWPAEGDDTWQPWLVNSMLGTQFPTISPSRPGKAIGFTDFTHARIREDE